MGSILPCLRPYDVFDAKTLTLLAHAIEKAVASVNDGRGHMLVTRHVLATSILDQAARGERRVDVLSGEALATLRCDKSNAATS